LMADIARDSRSVLLVTQPGRVASPGPGLLALSGTPGRITSDARNASPSTSVAATAL